MFGDVEQEERKCTNCWRREAYHVLGAMEEAERYVEFDIATDSIFCIKAAQIAYGYFICTALDEEQMSSLIWIDCADA